jgi:hypothetical protein
MPPTSRRGVFRSLRRLFQGRGEGPCFLGLQLVINCFGEDNLRKHLVELISAERDQNETPDEKRRFLKRIVALLIEVEPFWAYGYWDYIDDPERAAAEYRTWLSEIETAIATEEEEVGEEPDGLHRYSAERKYVAVSLLFLLDAPYPPAEVDDEDLFFKRTTFTGLVENLPKIDPRAVQADATFVVPGNPDDGFSDDDLNTEGWMYLRELW